MTKTLHAAATRAAACIATTVASLPALAHPGHGHTRTDTLLTSLRHLLTEPEHVLWIGLSVAAVVAVVTLVRRGDR